MMQTEPGDRESVTQLDESLWKAWRVKDRRKEERAAARWSIAVKCFWLAAILLAVFRTRTVWIRFCG